MAARNDIEPVRETSVGLHEESREDVDEEMGKRADVSISKMPSDNALERVQSSAFGDRPACFKNSFQEILFTFASTMAVGMSSFLSGAITVISTFIGRDLGMTTVQIVWIAAASGLSSGAFLLFFGRLSDLFGHRQIFIGSLIIFTILLVGTGFANDGITVDVLSGVIGLVTAAGVPAALGILGSSYQKPSPRKNAAFAVFSAGNPLGFVFGCIIAGVATQLASWRATYWALAIIYAAVAVTAFFAVPPDHSEKLPLNFETFKQFDFVGMLLTVAGVGLFSAALGMGSSAPEGWKTPYILAFLIIGLGLLIAFVFWERFYEYPLMPIMLYRDKNFCLLIAITGIGFLAFPVAMFWIALYFQQVAKYSPIEVAVHLLPCAISGICLNIAAGMLMHRVSNKLLMYIGAGGYTLAFTLYALNKEGITYWALVFPGAIFSVFGADLEFAVTNMYVMSSMPPQQQAVAGSLLQMLTRLTVTIGFGIATAIFDGVEQNPPTSGYYGNNAAAPYSSVFWYCAGLSAFTLCLVPFLTISTQGAKKPHQVEEVESEQVALPAVMGVQARGRSLSLKTMTSVKQH